MDSNFSLILPFCGLILILFSFAYYFLNAELLKGSLKTIRPRYKETFTTETPPVEAFRAIMQFALQNGYRVDDLDEQKLCVILNERMTLTSYGSLYPIYVRENAGKTEVEVGVTSKLGKASIGPINNKLITRRLERMLNGIKGAVFAFKKT